MELQNSCGSNYHYYAHNEIFRHYQKSIWAETGN